MSIKVYAYVLGVLLLATLLLYLHHLVYEVGYQARDRIAQTESAKALKDANDRVTQVRENDATAAQQTVNDYEAKLKTAAANSSSLTNLVLEYKAALRASAVPPATNTSSHTDIAPAGSVRDAAVNDAIAGAISACEHDSAQLAALQEWVSSTLH